MSDPTSAGGVPPRADPAFNFSALIDMLIIMVTLVVVKQTALPYSFLYAGPISTFTAMAVATFLLRRRGMSWADLGFRKPEHWGKTAGFAVLVLGTIVATTALANPLADLMFEDVGASGRFDHVEGNLWAYIGIMAVVWTHAAIFEEALFRAFVISKASAFLGGGLKADLCAVVFSAAFFGYRHYYYQGMNGALVTGSIGLSMGLLYIWIGRKNIWPLVLGHGAINSIAMTLRYLGIKD